MDQFAPCEQAADGASRRELAAMAANQVYVVGKGLDATVVGVEREGTDAVGPTAQILCLEERPYAVGTHKLRAIEQRQTLLRGERNRLPA